MFVTCDVETDLILDILIYIYWMDNIIQKKIDPNLEISVAVMMPCLKKEHKLFIVNWYSSPSLAMFQYIKKKCDY